MKIDELKQPLKFDIIHVDNSHGQNDYVLRGSINDQVIGVVAYSTYQDDDEFEVSVGMIEVHVKRNGYGKQLLRHIQSLYPNTEIQMGSLTEEGMQLVNSLTYTTIDSKYAYDFKTLDILKKQREELINSEDFDTVNDLHDEIDDLEELLYNKTPTIKLIN